MPGSIRFAEEVNEEPEVGSEQSRTEVSGVFRAVAAIIDCSVLEKEEYRNTEVAEDDIDDELDDLHRSEVLFPPGLNSDRRHGVVPVHEHVNDEVKRNRDPLL